MPIRIWAVSGSDLTVHQRFKKTIAPHAKRVCREDTQVDAHGLWPGVYPPGGDATEVCLKYPLTHQLIAFHIVENAIRAEREGYDAMVCTSFMDHGCELARSAVDIPVVGLGSSTLLVASTIASAFGLISHDPLQAHIVRNMAQHHGLDKRIRMLAALDPAISSEDLDAGMSGNPVLHERFRERALPFIKAGCDLLIPSEGFMSSALYLSGVHEVEGVPVFDCLGAAFAFAEMMVQLRRHAGLRISRRGDYARPPKAVLDHVLGITTEVLRAAQSAK